MASVLTTAEALQVVVGLRASLAQRNLVVDVEFERDATTIGTAPAVTLLDPPVPLHQGSAIEALRCQ